MLNLRRAAAKFLFVVVVVPWRAMQPWLLKLNAEEVVSWVVHVFTGLVAQREESVALRQRAAEPGPVLPRGTPNNPVPREKGGGGAVSRVSTHDSQNM